MELTQPLAIEPAVRGDAAAPARERAAAVLLSAGAFVIVLAWAPSRVFDLERYLVAKALTLHVVALGCLALGVVPLRRERIGRAGLLLAAFVGWSAIATIFATNRWLALEGWGVSFSAVVVFLTARSLRPSVRSTVFISTLVALVVGAALGVAQAYGLEWSWLSDSRPPGGTFGNRNFLGHLAAIAVPGVMMAALDERRRGATALALVGLAILTAAVVLTRSRAAWLGAMAGTGCAVVGWLAAGRGAVRTESSLGGRRLWAGGLVVAGAIAAAVLVPNQLDWVTDTPYAATLGNLADYQEGSGAGRLVQYENSLALVPGHPLFGVGPGNWFVHYPRVTHAGDPAYAAQEIIPTNPWPSSDWVAMLVERGALGALLLLAAGAAAVAAALRGGRDGADPRAAGAVAGMLAAALVCGAFDAVLLLAAPSYLVFAAVGSSLPPVEAPESVPGPDAPRSAAPRIAALAVALGLVLYTGAHTVAIAMTAKSAGTATLANAARWAPGEHRLRLLLGQRGRCADARAAGRLMPYHERVKRLSARCG